MWTTLYEANGVTCGRISERDLPVCFVVMDDDGRHVGQHYRLTFHGSEDGYVSVSVQAEWSDDRPGQLANFTHDAPSYIAETDELVISDEGVLTAMVKQRGACHVNIRLGFVVHLTVEYVEPVRLAIRMVRELAKSGSASACTAPAKADYERDAASRKIVDVGGYGIGNEPGDGSSDASAENRPH